MSTLDFLIIYIVGVIVTALFFIAEVRFFNNKTAWPMNNKQIKYLILMSLLWPLTVPALVAGKSSNAQ